MRQPSTHYSWALLLLLACEQEADPAPTRLTEPQGGDAITSPASAATTGSGPPDASAGVEALPPLPVSTEPFVFDERWPECIHPGVVADCADGWCRVPAGCYIFGSKEGEPKRAAFGEEQGPITQTYELEAMQHELTWDEWDETGWPRQENNRTCSEGRCPAVMNWLEAMLYANRLSEEHEPPLETCYEPGPFCASSPGQNMTCGEVFSKHPIHQCQGYRLPTQFEWQYLARAGTPTPFYTGDVHSKEQLDCSPNPALEGIAWYCGNTGEERRMRPVGGKEPNRWGFHDVIANASEWLNDGLRRGPQFPAVDPAHERPSTERVRITGGGPSHGWPTSLRVSVYFTGSMEGVRFVRTLGPGTLPTLE